MINTRMILTRLKRIGRTAILIYGTSLIVVPLVHAGPLTWRVWVIFLSGPTAALILLALWPEREVVQGQSPTD